MVWIVIKTCVSSGALQRMNFLLKYPTNFPLKSRDESRWLWRVVKYLFNSISVHFSEVTNSISTSVIWIGVHFIETLMAPKGRRVDYVLCDSWLGFLDQREYIQTAVGWTGMQFAAGMFFWAVVIPKMFRPSSGQNFGSLISDH